MVDPLEIMPLYQYHSEMDQHTVYRTLYDQILIYTFQNKAFVVVKNNIY